MNKTTVIVVCFIALCISQQAKCGLMVLEPVAGQKITYDDATGKSWIWDISMFVNQTYDEQIAAISALGNYGNQTGWHMASLNEVTEISQYMGYLPYGSLFAPTQGTGVTDFSSWFGRYDYIGPFPPNAHYAWLLETYIDHTDQTLGIYNYGPLYGRVYDSDAVSYMGAWAVTPVPPAVLLGVLGLCVTGLKLRKHRFSSNVKCHEIKI